MAIDYNTVFDCFVEIAEQVAATLPEDITVIIARQSGSTTPPYPYIQLDMMGQSQTEGYLQGWMVDENDDVIYETPYKLLLQYSVYGGNAQQIAHDLEAYFRLPSVLDKIEIDTTGTLEETFNITSSPERLRTNRWLEVAQFNLTFNIVDRMITSADGVIKTITIDGEVKRNEDDPDPLTFNVTESST